jgi:hypothetical protein
LKEIEEIGTQVIEIRKRVLGVEHPDTLIVMGNLAVTWEGQGKNEEALTLMSVCAEMRLRVLGADHPATLSTLEWLNERKTNSLSM